MARSSFGKREREQAKRAKAAAKRDRKQQPAPDPDPTEDTTASPPSDDAVSTDALLDMIAEVHAKYEAGSISYEDFETTRTDLLSRLVVD